MKPLDNIQTYLGYQEIFGVKSKISDVIRIIKESHNIGAILPILSQLASIKPQKSSYDIFKEDFRTYLYDLLEGHPQKRDEEAIIFETKKRIDSALSERDVISSQGVLLVWKYILAFGDSEFNFNFNKINDDYIKCFLLSLMLADHMYEEGKDILTEVFQLHMFYRSSDLGASLARTLVIYTQLAREKDRYKKEYVDFDDKFAEKFGYSLEDYIFVLFGIYTLFIIKVPEANRITHDWFQSIERAFSSTNLNQVALDILKPLMFTFNEAKAELTNNYKDPWDYRFFSRKPLFNYKDDIIFPVSLTLLENSFHEGLYWKIRSCFPEGDNSFQSFFGRPFELYVQNLIKESCMKSTVPYEVIEEFSYSKSSKRSPDVMIRLGSKFLAIESKAQRLNYKKSVVEGDIESIESDRIKMTVEPMEQIYSRINELLSGATGKIDLSGIDEIYLIVVNQGQFPVIPPIHQKSIEDWGKLSGIEIKVHFYYMSVDELEYFCSVLERRRPIFRLLDHKRFFPQISFNHFILKQYKNLSLPSILKDAKDQLVSRLSANRFISGSN